ncbi:MAG: manganese-binding transcriptional regulator MntR [Planctomycetota bacterium]
MLAAIAVTGQIPDDPDGSRTQIGRRRALIVLLFQRSFLEKLTVARKPTAAAHRRTRRDHASETAEDYVEAIADVVDDRGACRVTDLSERFGVSHVTVIRIIQRLERDGFITTEPYRPIKLTAKGKRLARSCRERHEIVYRFLLAIGVEPRVAAIDSEGIEHHVSAATLARFRDIADAHDETAG